MKSTMQLLQEALEKKLAYGPEGEPVSILLSNYAAKTLLEELKNLPNTEDDGK